MSWLDVIQIGHDLKVCPDCDREYEVMDEFLAKKDEPSIGLIGSMRCSVKNITSH